MSHLTETAKAAEGTGERSGQEGSLRSSTSNVARNFGSLLLGRFGSQALGFFTNAYLARRIAPGGFGAVGLAQSVISCLALFSDAGLGLIAVREGAQNPSRIQNLIGSITGLRLLISFALLPVGLIAAEFLPFSESSRAVLRVFAFTLPLQALAVYWVFRALQRMYYATIVQIGVALLTLVLTLAFVRTPHHLLRVPWLSFLTCLGGCGLAVYLLGRAGYKLSVNLRLGDSWRYLQQSLPLCAATFALVLYYQANCMIVGKVHGDAEVGMYTAAYRAATVFFGLTWLYFTAMAPALMELYARSQTAAAALLKESVRLTAAAGCGVAVVGAAGSGLIVNIVFGAAFSAARPAFAVMLFSGTLAAIAHNWAQLAIAAHREKLIMRATLSGGIANLIVCCILVGRFASLGAAIGNLIGELVVACVLILSWPVEAGLRALKPAAAPAALAALALLAGSQVTGWGSLANPCVTGAVYAAGLVMTGTVGARDLRRLRAALQKPAATGTCQ